MILKLNKIPLGGQKVATMGYTGKLPGAVLYKQDLRKENVVVSLRRKEAISQFCFFVTRV